MFLPLYTGESIIFPSIYISSFLNRMTVGLALQPFTRIVDLHYYVVLGQLYSSTEGSAIFQSSAVDPLLDINQWGTKVRWTS